MLHFLSPNPDRRVRRNATRARRDAAWRDALRGTQFQKYLPDA